MEKEILVALLKSGEAMWLTLRVGRQDFTLGNDVIVAVYVLASLFCVRGRRQLTFFFAFFFSKYCVFLLLLFSSDALCVVHVLIKYILLSTGVLNIEKETKRKHFSNYVVKVH